MDVVSCGAGARFRRSSPFRSPSRSSPSCHKRRESGSLAHSGKLVRLYSPSSAIRGCLGDCWEIWESWGADPWVVEVLRCGYRIPFRVLPSLSTVPIPLPSYSPSSIGGIALNAAVADLIAKGAVEPAPLTPGFYSRLFVTPKVTGGWRPVIGLSRPDHSVLVSHFHMETAQSVLQSLRQGDWMVSLDLQNSYLQVLVHPSSRHYLRFCVGGFGATVPCTLLRSVNCSASVHTGYGPYIFSHAPLRVPNFALSGRLARPQILVSDIVRARDFLLWLCHELGVCINLAKSSLDPSHTLDYLGMRLQTLPFRVFPTPKCVQKLSSLLHESVSSAAAS